MDAVERRPQLPAFSFIDNEKFRPKEEPYRHRTIEASRSLSSENSASPTGHYTVGPYSHNNSNNNNNQPGYTPLSGQQPKPRHGSQADISTAPISRRSSGDGRDDSKQTIRQSLPSISDVLAIDDRSSYSTPHPPPVSTSSQLAAASQSQAFTHLSSSSSPRSLRMYGRDAPPASYANGSYQPSHHAEKSREASSGPSENARSALAPTGEPNLASHPAYGQPSSRRPPTATHGHGTEPRSSPEQLLPSASSGSNGASSFAYGYTSFPPRYSNPPQPPTSHPPQASLSQLPSIAPGPSCSPPSTFGASTGPTPTWKSESRTHLEDTPTGQGPYGVNVKRHLEYYDLTTALTDIAHSSGALADFSRRYGDQMHNTQRAGASLAMLPSIVEIDDMITKSRSQLDAVVKIREVILAQQVAFEQQAADQRQQQELLNGQSLGSLSGSERVTGDGKASNFGGADARKRRGRAAPPGRCHSCNRAETPEWRRGPDGARTLCNACGLHYAKLTRKGNYKQNTSMGSSNLRPKENEGL